MNKLVIIGNGFDLAHGLKTSYKDFILWHINKVFKKQGQNTESELMKINSNLDKCKEISTVNDLKELESLNSIYEGKFKMDGKYDFINKILKNIERYNWVDIEKEYYGSLVNIFESYNNDNSYDNTKELNDLNKALYLIGVELKEYLENHIKDFFIENQSIISLFDSEILNDPDEDVYVLNFNYTSFVENYLPKLTKSDNESTLKSGIVRIQDTKNGIDKTIKVYLNHIHGELGSDNQLIFGYGDETDKYYEKIEDLKDNEFLKHMKSFAYLQSSNYKRLFEFLDQEHLREDVREKFDVYIMGHSCGVSDRLLFTHILEHSLLNSVKLYYYQKLDGTNDFYEKTQELSRYFRKDAKHKMRKCVIPFKESRPLCINHL